MFKDVTSSDAMKGYVISGVTAGLTKGLFDGWTGTQTNPNTGAVITSPAALNTWTGVGQFAANQALQNGTSTLLSKALGQGGDFGDALKGALFNTLAAASFNAIGDYTHGVLTEGYPPKIVVHAMVGGLLSKATGGDFRTGALAAGINEALVVHLDSLVKGDKTLLSMSSQIVGVLAAASQKDADAKSIEKGGWVAKNATEYNYLGDHQKAQREKELAESSDSLDRLRINTKWELIDAGQDASFAGGAVVGVPEGLLDTVKGILEAASSPMETFRALKSVVQSGDVLGNVSDAMKQSYIQRIDNLEAEYERAGASGSFNAGRETGKLISEVAALATGVGGALKGGALLVEKVAAKVVKVELKGAKGPVQVIPDAISPPKLSPVEDLFGQTFESIPLSHLPNWKTGSLVNDGVLGEQLALQTLNGKTGLNFKPLQNGSNHGCDGCAVAINGDTITVVVMDAKSSVNGVSKAGTPHGDPRTRLEGQLGNKSIADSDPALRDALQAELDSGKAKVQGLTVKVGVPAPGKTGVAEFKVEPWTKK
ncbi:Possible hemagglutinin [Pseudomonas extremorientalis]|uniref:Possible hemagglutinin n=1 Tax=Pseudomonas extremorientalis TaxID=169669 RepID=A0ABY0S5D1_9PSED|nr:Possible hemagglutinin [Pseudomonas extremorientalis]